MDELWKSAASPYWWITAVLLALILNLVSEYIKRLFDFLGSRIWTKWRDRTEIAKARYAENVQDLKADTNLQFLVLLRALQLRSSANSWLLVSVLLFIYCSLHINLEFARLIVNALGHGGTERVDLPNYLFFAAAVCALRAMWLSIGAKHREKLVMDARSPEGF